MKKPKANSSEHEQRRIESGNQKDKKESEGGEKDAQSAVDRDVLRVAVSGLNEQRARF